MQRSVPLFVALLVSVGGMRADAQVAGPSAEPEARDKPRATATAKPAVSVLSGEVVAIADGDTLTLLDSQKQHRIRLYGIDAPEGGQAFGKKAKQALAEKVFRKQVRVEQKDVDRYGRIVGVVMLDGRDINREIVREGWAWHFVRYAKNDRALAEAERLARQDRCGLWADLDPTPPWEFRRDRRGVNSKQAPP